MRETVKAAGGLVINKKGQILFIHRKGVWDLPKGKLDSGERLDNTAIRETSEETGIPLKKLKLVTYLTNTSHPYYNDKIDIKEISWYLLKTKYDGELIPEESEGISKCEWFDVDYFYLIKEECLPRIQYLVNFYTQLLRFDLI